MYAHIYYVTLPDKIRNTRKLVLIVNSVIKGKCSCKDIVLIHYLDRFSLRSIVID